MKTKLEILLGRVSHRRQQYEAKRDQHHNFADYSMATCYDAMVTGMLAAENVILEYILEQRRERSQRHTKIKE